MTSVGWRSPAIHTKNIITMEIHHIKWVIYLQLLTKPINKDLYIIKWVSEAWNSRSPGTAGTSMRLSLWRSQLHSPVIGTRSSLFGNGATRREWARAAPPGSTAGTTRWSSAWTATPSTNRTNKRNTHLSWTDSNETRCEITPPRIYYTPWFGTALTELSRFILRLSLTCHEVCMIGFLLLLHHQIVPLLGIGHVFASDWMLPKRIILYINGNGTAQMASNINANGRNGVGSVEMTGLHSHQIDCMSSWILTLSITSGKLYLQFTAHELCTVEVVMGIICVSLVFKLILQLSRQPWSP